MFFVDQQRSDVPGYEDPIARVLLETAFSMALRTCPSTSMAYVSAAGVCSFDPEARPSPPKAVLKGNNSTRPSFQMLIRTDKRVREFKTLLQLIDNNLRVMALCQIQSNLFTKNRSQRLEMRQRL